MPASKACLHRTIKLRVCLKTARVKSGRAPPAAAWTRLRPQAVELISTENGLPFESVRSVCEDSTGAIWATTRNGLLVRQQGNDWAVVSLATNAPGTQANCVAADPSGAIWIGTTTHGLLRFQDGQFNYKQVGDSTVSDAVHGLFVSSSGDLWVIFALHVERIHDNQLEEVALPAGNRYPRAIAEDTSGNVWIGTSEGRLFRIKDTVVTDETVEVQGGPLSIRCLYCTSDGALWIGYAGSGLGCFKNGKFSRLTTKNGLHDDFISQIVADKSDRLWLASNGGIFYVPIKNLSDAMEGRTARVRSVLYGRSEGLPSLQATYDGFPGSTFSRDGRIWIATQTGLAVIHTENISDTLQAPPVLIDGVAVDGQLVAAYDSHSPLRETELRGLTDLSAHPAALQLSAHYRKLEIKFTALSFTAPDNVNCRYRLEGFEDTWNEAWHSAHCHLCAFERLRLPVPRHRLQ